jgi:hypothetical protein
MILCISIKVCGSDLKGKALSLMGAGNIQFAEGPGGTDKQKGEKTMSY